MGVGGYPADRYVTIIFNLICLVSSTESLVQLRRVNKTQKIVLRTFSGYVLTANETRERFYRIGSRLPTPVGLVQWHRTRHRPIYIIGYEGERT